MTRSAITTGLPSPNFVNETSSTRSAILSGTYEAERLILPAVAASLSVTLVELLLSSTAIGICAAALDVTIADLTLSATATRRGLVIPNIVLHATVKVGRKGDGIWPLWWVQYVAVRRAEQAAAKQKWIDEHAVEGDGYAIMVLPIGHGEFEHDPDAEAIPWIIAAWALAA
jgi:hypothetical protein